MNDFALSCASLNFYQIPFVLDPTAFVSNALLTFCPMFFGLSFHRMSESIEKRSLTCSERHGP